MWWEKDRILRDGVIIIIKKSCVG